MVTFSIICAILLALAVCAAIGCQIFLKPPTTIDLTPDASDSDEALG